jgi:hypothetical protein
MLLIITAIGSSLFYSIGNNDTPEVNLIDYDNFTIDSFRNKVCVNPITINSNPYSENNTKFMLVDAVCGIKYTDDLHSEKC